MRALTICQPYAELIMRGEKRVENRTWPKADRFTFDLDGPLLIHAGKSRKWLLTYPEVDMPDHMDFGAIIGVVEVGGIYRLDNYSVPRWIIAHKHTEGPVCWCLENPRRFEKPIPYIGRQNIWHVPDHMLPEI